MYAPPFQKSWIHPWLFNIVFINQTQLEIEKAMAEDPTVYEYDSIYDDMEDKKRQKDIKKANLKNREVRIS